MISKNAIVETNKIGDNTVVKEFAVVRSNVELGKNVIIHPHVVIESGVVIGDNVEIFPGAYIGKEPKGAGATARLPIFDKKIVIGNNVSIGPGAVIYYDVKIGNNTLIGDGASIREQCIVGEYCIISRYVTINYNSVIGDKVKIMDLSHITGNCFIGDNVFISTHVCMVNDNNMGGKGYVDEIIQGPRIENSARIGAGVVLLPKIVIGKNAVVAVGSVVNKDVRPNVLVAGNPARFVCDLHKINGDYVA